MAPFFFQWKELRALGNVFLHNERHNVFHHCYCKHKLLFMAAVELLLFCTNYVTLSCCLVQSGHCDEYNRNKKFAAQYVKCVNDMIRI